MCNWQRKRVRWDLKALSRPRYIFQIERDSAEEDIQWVDGERKWWGRKSSPSWFVSRVLSLLGRVPLLCLTSSMQAIQEEKTFRVKIDVCHWVWASKTVQTCKEGESGWELQERELTWHDLTQELKLYVRKKYKSLFITKHFFNFEYSCQWTPLV